MKRGTLDSWLQKKPDSKSAPQSSPAPHAEVPVEVSTPSTGSAPSPTQTSALEPDLPLPQPAPALEPSTQKSAVLSFRVLDKPKADYRGIPNEELGDLLYITDFVWTFRKQLRVESMTVPDLQAALRAPADSAPLCSVLRALVREVAFELVSRVAEDSTADALPRVRIMSKVKAQVDFNAVCENAFLPLAQEFLLWSLHASDCESDFSERLQQSPLDTCFFSCDYRDRVAVLGQLCDLVADCASIHDVLGLRLEEKKTLGQKKAELTAQLRAFNKQHKGQQLTKSSPEGMMKANLKSEIAKVSAAIRAIPLRTEPLGYDRSENRYFRFGFDPTRVFVQRFQSSESAQDFWFCYQSRDLQRKLARAMNSKHACEMQLKEALEKVIAEDPLQMEEEMEIDPPQCVVTRDEVCRRLIELEGKVTGFFEANQKCWETGELVQIWRTQVEREESLEALKLLLLEFAKKANSPLKNCSSAPGLSRKGSIRLWNDYGEALQDWLDVWSACSSYPDLWFLVATLEAVFSNYFQKKRSGVLSQKELEQCAQ